MLRNKNKQNEEANKIPEIQPVESYDVGDMTIKKYIAGIPEITVIGDIEEELREYLELLAVDICETIMIDPSIPLIINAIDSETKTFAQDGVALLGDNGYSYAKITKKDTKEEFIVVSINCDYEDDITMNLVLAISDIVSLQIEKVMIPDNVKENTDVRDTLNKIRSASAIALAYKCMYFLCEFDDIEALEDDDFFIDFEDFIDKFTSPEYYTFEDYVNLDIDTDVKLGAILELLAFYYASGQTVKETWASSHLMFKTVERLEEKLFDIYRKLKVPNLIEDEIIDEEEMQNLENMLIRAKNNEMSKEELMSIISKTLSESINLDDMYGIKELIDRLHSMM